ncbi:MAG: hypothetical protein P8X73_18485 [Ignavibacteriaceae bacterium]
MKKIIMTFIIIFITTSLSAQVINITDRQKFKQFDWECNTSLSIGLSSKSSESSSQYYYSNNSGNGEFYSEISLALGFYILDGLSIEPEIEYNFFEGDATLSLIGNVAYTLNLPGKKIYPFFKIGYGISGYSAYGYNYYERSSGLFESLNAKVINAGIGLKIVQSSLFAMRIELNYKNIRYAHSQEVLYDGSYDISTNTSALSIKIGGSFIF